MTSYKHPPPLKKVNSLLSKITEDVFQEHGFAAAAIILEWEEIIGRDFAQFCEPIKIVFGRPQQRSHGLLHIRVIGAMAVAISHYEEMIINRINQYFGYRAVNRVRIAQNVLSLEPREKKTKKIEESINELDKRLLKEAVSSIEGEALQNALFRLGCKVLAHDQHNKK